MPSYTRLATSPAVLDPVIHSLGLDLTSKELARQVSATTPRDTVVMQVVVRAPVAAEAADIANGIVEELADSAAAVGPRLGNGRTLVTASSIQTAVPAVAPILPNTKQNTALGLAAGFVLGCALVLLADRLRWSVTGAQAVARTTDAPVIGVLEKDLGLTSGLASGQPSGNAFGELREMATIVESQLPPTTSRVLLVVSALQGEGRTTVATGLAAALVERGHGTVVVEVDSLRPDPAMARPEDDGADAAVLVSAPSGFATTRASTLLARRSSPDTAARLRLPDLSSELDLLAQEYDYLVLDTRALLESEGALLVGALQTDTAAIVVAGSGRVRHGQLAEVLTRLNNRGLGVLGVVLNAQGGPASRRHLRGAARKERVVGASARRTTAQAPSWTT